jgi:hypothetical protein
MKNDYYVYLYLRSCDSSCAPRLSPYYVGKGRNKRAFSFHRTIPRPRDKQFIVFAEENLTEAEAFALEKYYIALYGRIDNGTGILRNLTDGGEGSSGFKHSPATCALLSKLKQGTKISEEQKKQISQFHTGKKKSEETKRKISEGQKGKIISQETRQKISAARKGRKLSDEHRRNIAEAGKGRHPTDETRTKLVRAKAKYLYELTAPEGFTVTAIGLGQVAKQYNLQRRALYAVAVGTRSHHKGWKVRIIEKLR